MDAALRPVVLVVDDDAIIRDALADLLSETYDVRAFRDGASALECLDAQASTIILDIRLEGESGFDVSRAVRQRNALIPIIFFSAYQDLEDPYVILNEHRPFAYITKGEPIGRLTDAVARAVAYHDELRGARLSVEPVVKSLLETAARETCAERVMLVVERSDALVVEAECNLADSYFAVLTGRRFVVADDADKPVVERALHGATPGAAPPDALPHITSASHPATPLVLVAFSSSDDGRGLLCLATTQRVTHEQAQTVRVLAREAAMLTRHASLLMRARGAEAREEALRHMTVQTQLKALQARLNPHFLFNSLNAAAALTRIDPPRAERVLLQLSVLFRHTLEGTRSELVPWRDELEVVRSYLEIEHLRLGDRLRTVIEVAPGLDSVAVPPLFLQPLVENAVIHGISPRPTGGCVLVQATLDGTLLHVRISDDGVGLGGSAHAGSRTTYTTLVTRLRLLFGDSSSVTQESPAAGGLSVTVTFPIHSI